MLDGKKNLPGRKNLPKDRSQQMLSGLPKLLVFHQGYTSAFHASKRKTNDGRLLLRGLRYRHPNCSADHLCEVLASKGKKHADDKDSPSNRGVRDGSYHAGIRGFR